MGNLSPVILDISSDEEAGFGEPGGGGFGHREDHDWLSELLREVDGNKDDDDSDDVVFVSEVLAKSPSKSRLLSSNSIVVAECGGDDDDCVVLDGDPEKPVMVENCRPDDDGDGGSDDDLEIVGEKGEVACRDFPHPRHLCGKFIFASTPHEVHCSQCHCYVCDSVAPCLHWGSGCSSIDHCHATDKEEYWITERKARKEGVKPMPIIPTVHIKHSVPGLQQTTEVPGLSQPQPDGSLLNHTLIPVIPNVDITHSVPGLHQTTEVPRLSQPQLDGSLSNHTVMPVIPTVHIKHSVPGLHQTTEVPGLSQQQPDGSLLNHTMRPATTRPCTASSNICLPNAINEGRRHPVGTGHNVSRYRPQQQLLPSQLHLTCNSYVTARGSYNAVNRSSLLSPSPAVFKRTLSTGALPNNRARHYQRYGGSQLSTDHSLKRCHTLQTSSLLNEYHNSSLQNTGIHTGNSMFTHVNLPPPMMDVGCANILPSQPQIHPPLISSCPIKDPVTQPQLSYQPNLSGDELVTAVPFQPQVSSQPIVRSFQNITRSQLNCSAPSPTLLSKQSDIGDAFGYQLQSRSTLCSHPNMGNAFGNQSSQQYTSSNSSHLLIDDQNNFQQSVENQSGLGTSVADFGLDWDVPLGHGNIQAPKEMTQLQNVAPANNFQNQSVIVNDCHRSVAPVSDFHRQYVAPVVDFHHQYLAQPDNSSLLDDTNCQFSGISNSDKLDFQFESWMLDNQSPPRAFEVPVSPQWNAFSPEPTSTDAGTFFNS